MNVRKILPPFIFALLLAALCFFIVDRYIIGLTLHRFFFFGTRKESAYTVAEEIDDLYILNTSEYRLKLIFPYDFVDRDLNWWSIREMRDRKIEAGPDIQPSLDIYEACLESGLDPAATPYNFIVITAVVKAGIPLGSTPFDRGDADLWMKVDRGGTGRIITLRLPEPEITGMMIDDRKPAADNFPDASMTPAQWRNLVGFLNPLIRERVLEMGILDDAGKSSRKLIEKILKDSGFDVVLFTETEL